MSDISNIVKQKWFMPVALGVAGLSFILFLKKSNNGDGTTQYQDYSAVPAEKAEALAQSMMDMEDRLKQGQLDYLSTMTDSLSSITDQIKDVELKINNPASIEQPTASNPTNTTPITPAPVVEPTVRNVQVGYTRTTIGNLAKEIGVNQDTLLQLNPGLTPNSKIGGAFLNLPVPAPTPAAITTTPSAKVVNGQEVRSVAVGNARTWDNLAKDLGVSKQTLIALNPGLNANSKIGGKTINLPKK